MASCSDEPGNEENEHEVVMFVQEIHEILRSERGNKIDISKLKAAYKKKFERKLKLPKLGLGNQNKMLAFFWKIANEYDSLIAVKNDGKSYCIQLKEDELSSKGKASKSVKELRDGLTENQLRYSNMASSFDKPGNKENEIEGFIQEIHEILRNEHENKIDISKLKAAYKKKFKRELKLPKLQLRKQNVMLAFFWKIDNGYNSPIAVKKDGKSYCIQLKENELSSEAIASAKELRDELTEHQLSAEPEDKGSPQAGATAPEVKQIPLPLRTSLLNLQEGSSCMLNESIVVSTSSLSPGGVFGVDASSPENASSSHHRQIKAFSEIMEEQFKQESPRYEELSYLSFCQQAKQNSARSKVAIDESLDQIKSLRKPGEIGPFEQAFHDSQKPIYMPSPQGAKPKRPNMLQLNETTKKIIYQIAQSGNCVLVEEVKRRLCLEFGVENLKEVGVRKPEKDIMALSDLIKLQAKVNLYTHAYVMVHSISTLHELGQSLPSLEQKEEFQDLNLGPLVKQPVVYDLFKFPSDDEIPSVTTVQILRLLKRYMDKEELWTKKVDLKKFMEYLCQEFKCETPYQLGVRIQSIGLAISVYKKSQRTESEKRKAAFQQIEEDLERDIDRNLRRMRKELLGERDGDLRSLVQKLQDSSISDIVVKIYECCEDMFSGKNKTKVQNFLKMLTSDANGRKLFELAVHIGCRKIQKLPASYDESDRSESKEEDHGSQDASNLPPPREDEVVKKIMEWLGKVDRLDLTKLTRIEEEVEAYFPGFDSFYSLGHGPFLQFVTRHKEILEAIEQVLSSPSDLAGNNVSSHSVSLANLLDFILQCGKDLSLKTIEEALCSQFGVKSVTELGFGNIEKLISKTNKMKQNELVSEKERRLFYEAALLVRRNRTLDQTVSVPCTTGNLHVGVLGYKDRDAALLALENVPFLENLAVHTHWNEVFRPTLGSLREFLKREGILATANNHKSSACALETSSGTLLRITSNSSPDMFRACVSSRDTVGASGHVVSLVVANGCIANSPLSMLGNHVRSALASYTAEHPEQEDETHCAKFVLECITRIPSMLCKELVREVFLNPLWERIGSNEAPGLLLSCCTSGQQRSALHLLGLQLGVTEWKDDFERVISATISEEVRMAEQMDHKTGKRPVAVVKPHETQLTLQEEDKTESGDEIEEQSGEVKTPEMNSKEEGLSEAQEDLEDNRKLEDERDELENNCKMVIEQIRQDEFGIGIDLGEKETRLVKIQREREGRSLHRLSTELYSKDTHFVLELVQNADDNSYPQGEEGLTPSLKFIVANDKVTVLNNEIGFSEKNIRALCDVGRSTKGAHRYGYIGQKGIGFKSVFRVTDQPEVHSNGYHIQFDAKSGPIGYILPQWIGKDSDRRREELGEETETSQGWTTRIVLPLKDELIGTHKSSLWARFRDVHPSLLIFLHRLRSIAIEDKVNKTSHEMKRKDLGNNIMEITHKQGVDHWLVIKKQLDASKMKEGVKMTELALAFPLLKNDGEAATALQNPHGKSLPQQNVFAFLPLRSYGFRFIIQGDFEVPSSREDVDGDKAWNQWLREEIPLLFVEALDEFRIHPKFKGLSSLKTFFRFVPLEDEILDFFAPVARNILKLLQGKCCVPVEDSSKGFNVPGKRDGKAAMSNDCADPTEDDHHMVKPCEVVDTSDSEVIDLISPALLLEHLGLYYLNREISAAVNPVLKANLGIKRLTTKHLIEIGRQETKKAAAREMKEADIKWKAKWLWCVYRSMEHEHDSSQETLEDIASIPLFPLANGRSVDLRGESVFYPLTLGQGTAASAREKSNDKAVVRVLEKDLPILHEVLFSSLDSIGRSQVAHLLKQLGVKSFTPKDVIYSHILPTLKSDKWKDKTNDTVRSYLVYIFVQRSRDPTACDMNDLKQWALVLTNKGALNPSTTPIHFTPKYGNTIDLQRLFPSVSWTMLDDSYLATCGSAQGWEKFFSELGVHHFLAIERKQIKLSSLTQSPWEQYDGIWPNTPDGCYVIEDYKCLELEELFSSNLSEREALELAQCLDKQWSTEYSKFAEQTVPYKDTSGRHLGVTFSSFYINLLSKSWMCTLSTDCADSVLKVPKDLYLDVEEVRNLLGTLVPYVKAKLRDESFIAALGIKKTVTLDLLLDEIHRWTSIATRRNRPVEKHKEFVVPFCQIKRINFYLLQNCLKSSNDRETIYKAFQENPLVFLPVSSQTSDQSPCPGKFYHKKEVCWEDPSGVVKKQAETKGSSCPIKRELLCRHYPEPDLKKFFLEILRIDHTPNIDEYINLAATITEGSVGPTPSTVEDIFSIFTVLGNKDIQDLSWLRDRLKHQDIFPCKTRWASLEDKPLIPDDQRLMKIFLKESRVFFIDIEQICVRSKPSRHGGKSTRERINKELVLKFLGLCGIVAISSSVEETSAPEMVLQFDCPEVQQHFHFIIPYTQRFIFDKDPEIYDDLKAQDVGVKIESMRFLTVKGLETVYSLTNNEVDPIKEMRKCGVEKTDESWFFYTVQGHTQDKNALNEEIAKLLSNGKRDFAVNLIGFLALLLSNNPEIVIDMYNLPELPQGEKKWNVEMPVLREPTPPPEIQEDNIVESLPQRYKEGDGDLHSWPPKSSTAYNSEDRIVTEQTNKEVSLKMWPPPAPPESVPPNPKMASFFPSSPEQTETQLRSSQAEIKVVPQEINSSLKVPYAKTNVEHAPRAPIAAAVCHSFPAQPQLLAEAPSSPSPMMIPAAVNPHVEVLPPTQPSPLVAADELSLSNAHQNQFSLFSPRVSESDKTEEIEELPVRDISIPEGLVLQDSANKEEVGRWGEIYVFEYLKKQKELAGLSKNLEIKWMNEAHNTTAPYDFEIHCDGHQTTFIEVKSTRSHQKDVFEISPQELAFAMEKRDDFHLYRVFGAGLQGSIKLLRMRNVAKLLDNKTVKLCMFI